MTIKKLVISCSVISMLSGYALPAYSYDNILGTIIGAAGGAAVGSNIGKGKGNIAAIAVGTLIGAGIGSGIGNSINNGNVYAANYHDNSNYKYHSSKVGHNYNKWHSGYRSGHHHYKYNNYTRIYQPYPINPAYNTQIIQVNDYQIEQPQAEEYCREFNQNITINGKTQPGYGIACLQPDGSWKIKK